MLACALVQRPLGGCQSHARSAHLPLGLHSHLRRNVRIINLVREVVHDCLSVLKRLLLCSAGVRPACSGSDRFGQLPRFVVFRSFPGGFRLFCFSRLRAFGFRLASLCHVHAPRGWPAIAQANRCLF